MNDLLNRIVNLMDSVEGSKGSPPTTIKVSYDVDRDIKLDLMQYATTDRFGNIRTVFGLEYFKEYYLPAGTVIVQ